MRIRKSLVIGICMMSAISRGWTQTGIVEQEQENIQICDAYKVNISGPYDVKQTHTNYYQMSLQNKETSKTYAFESLTGAKAVFSIFVGGKQTNSIAADTGGGMFYAFPNLTLYEIRGVIKKDACTREASKIVRVYNNMFLYIGDFLQDFNFGLQDNIQQNNDIIATIFTNDIQQEQEIRKRNINYIAQSDIIFINIHTFATIFETLDAIEKSTDIADKKIVLVNDIDTTLIKKLLTPFIAKSQRKNIYIIKKKDLTDFFLNLSIGKKTTEPESIFAISGEKTGWKYSLGTVIDTLIYNGVPLELIGLILTLSICITILVCLRQVIGIPGYGLYYPLIAAMSLYSIGRKLSIVFFCMAICAHILTVLITQRINLLVYAKIGIYLITYSICILIGLHIYLAFIDQNIEVNMFSASILLLIVMIIAISGKKVFTETKSIHRIKRRIHIVRFSTLTYICMEIITWKWLQYQLLIWPEIILGALLLTIIIGRFSGLQVIEYIRFRPLIRNQIRKKNTPKKTKKIHSL